MFTGIVEETGTVLKSGNPLVIKAKKILEDIHLGDSIAVNGICLTVTSFTDDTITLDVMNETYGRTNLRHIKYGTKVNLERAMSAGGRFGGHIVSGHIDGTGILTDITSDGIAKWLTISADSSILKYIVLKGSVTLDGVSLTVAYVDDKIFKLSVIPHTQSETTLLLKSVGSEINIETDIIGKYVEKFTRSESRITMDFLRENGF
mgnify:CR=1 FL=1